MLHDRLTNVQILKSPKAVVGHVNLPANEFIKKSVISTLFLEQILRDKLLLIFSIKKKLLSVLI